MSVRTISYTLGSFISLSLCVEVANALTTKHVICTGLTDAEVRVVKNNISEGKLGKEILPGNDLKPVLEWQEEYANPQILATGGKITGGRALKIRLRASDDKTTGVGQLEEDIPVKMYFSPAYKISSPTRITFAQSDDDPKAGYTGDGLYRIIGMAKDSRRNPFATLKNEWTLLEDTKLANDHGDIWSFTGNMKNTNGNYGEKKNRMKLWCKTYENAPGLNDKQLLLYALYTKNEKENKVIQWMTSILQPAEIIRVKYSSPGFDPIFTIQANMPGAGGGVSKVCGSLIYSTVGTGGARGIFSFTPSSAAKQEQCPITATTDDTADPVRIVLPSEPGSKPDR